ncbi:MAG TPA: hypothetical protein VE029_03615 [Rhizobacter sp.]|nr:hypothetical protein [Rhizobacter sp.]
MRILWKPRCTAGSMVLAAAFVAAGNAVAEEDASTAVQIYQQRTADGRIVLTDRPVTGAVTQRTWQPAPEDAAEARTRREQARLDALAVSERVQRGIDADRQRVQELTLARMQLAEAEARRDAAQARAEEAVSPAIVFVPTRELRPFPRPPRQPRPGSQRPRSPTPAGMKAPGELPT